MILRIIYKIWVYFWRTFFVLTGVVLVLMTILVGLLQLPQSKTYINQEISSIFNNQFEGTLKIDRISGFLPFTATLHNGEIFAPSDSLNPKLRFDETTIRIDLWSLLQRNLTITSFSVTNPSLILNVTDDTLSIAAAFKQNPEWEGTSDTEIDGSILLNRISLFAPSIQVMGGMVELDDTINLSERAGLHTPLTIDNLNLSIFLELSDPHIFFDLYEFSANLPGTPYETIRLNGQFYNDDEFFELNRFRVETSIGSADFSMEATPVSLFSQNLEDQFRAATYRFQITESSLSTTFIQQFATLYPDFDEHLELELLSEGTLESYYFDRVQANIGESSILISGEINDLLTPNISYDAHLDNLVIHPTTMDWISENFLENRVNLNRYQLSTVRGSLNGDQSQLNSNVRVETEAGDLSLEGNLAFNELLEYDLMFNVDTLDITPFLTDTVNSSIIQGSLTLEGTGTGELANFNSSIDLSQSSLLGYDVNEFIANLTYANSTLYYELQGGDDQQFFVSASGLYSVANGLTNFITDGVVRNLDLKKFIPDFHADQTTLNSTFSGNVTGSNFDNLRGRVSLEMAESYIDADTLRPHQFYADLNESSSDSRTLRFTSSFFDGEMSGTVIPSRLQNVYHYWREYFYERVNDEILFTADSMNTSGLETFYSADQLVADLNIQMTVKDVSLLRIYFPNLPDVESSVRFNSSINSTDQRLLITGTLFEQFFKYGDIETENLNSAFTASFRSDRKFRESTTLDLQVNSSKAIFNDFGLKDSYFNLSVRDDSIRINTALDRLDDDLLLESTITGFLRPGELNLLLDDFHLGNLDYQWRVEGRPMLRYNNEKALSIDNLILTSGLEYLEINGTYSDHPEDQVEYIAQNLNLSRVSDLINGRIKFSGNLNGNFKTQTLSQIPVFEGDLKVDEGRILDRLIGDVSMNSTFNPSTNHFDTRIHVYTDPEKYSQYLSSNDGVGQDILLTGFFRLPDDSLSSNEDLFYFDADIREIDMWIVTFIIPKFITEMEGSAIGSGFIRGSQNDIDFESTFRVEKVHAVPFFTNVPYTMSGELDFNMDEGFLFRDVNLTDSRGGTGKLYGQVDLDRFSPLTILDLTLDLNDLHFMNNSYDPDVPFYGNIYGTGQAQILGTNSQPVLRTTRPLLISSDSQISVPLEPATEFDEDRRFIEFVESFNNPFSELNYSELRSSNNENGDDEKLTFMQLFTMDLQFQATDPITVGLIFDRVTNDILNASGTGQVRVLLEDQNVSMFGRFNISGGDYQFVTGDIFSRTFTLQENGTISWSGDLVDAALDVTAVYRARPNISTLLSGTGSSTLIDPNLRIPIELVLQIGGSISAVENEFFFRIPSGIESSGDPTIASQISNLNQNADLKLIQATSILLSGNFIPTEQAQGLGIAENLTGTAVVNPLITSQVINPLLSNQINNLLRSDVTFDIDFNLTTANEVDLGVALRLFDDRVVLRREGQITGEQSDIGDIGATYRINRALSVTAFHRQDPTLAYTSGMDTRQTQEMNGVGFEAQMQFNTWQNLCARLSRAFRSFFGIKEKESDDDDTEMTGS
ncbi:MAG: hypothetical protein WD513_06475 [Balneolaceae bacterium]